MDLLVFGLEYTFYGLDVNKVNFLHSVLLYSILFFLYNICKFFLKVASFLAIKDIVSMKPVLTMASHSSDFSWQIPIGMVKLPK